MSAVGWRGSSFLAEWPLHEAEEVAEGVPHDSPLQIGTVAGVVAGWLHDGPADVFRLTNGERDVLHSEVKMGSADPTVLVLRHELK